MSMYLYESTHLNWVNFEDVMNKASGVKFEYILYFSLYWISEIWTRAKII